MSGKSKVIIGKGILEQLPHLINLQKYSKVFAVVDKKVDHHFVNQIEKIIARACGKIILPGGEQTKTLESVQKIWQAMLDFNLDRKSLVINIGGGSIGDVGGFAASTFKRGVDFVQVPTTLLAQVDASIGGKVGINFAGIKNLIGTFEKPLAIIADIDILSTLPQREFISGFAEIIKHGVIEHQKYFQLVTAKRPPDFSARQLVKIIKGSYQIKSRIAYSDEKETGPRKLLNFGHTIGHAVEGASQNTDHPLLHGEAVSIGMVAEAKISYLIGMLSLEKYHILEQSLIKAGLPTAIPDIPADQILQKIKSDKKNDQDQVNWTLIKDIGEAVFNQKVDEAVVRKVL